MSILGGLYGRAAGWRRAWYDAAPHRRQQLARPVVSVGNIAIGGSGKTPTVAAIATLLQQLGERPAILSRGYGRRDAGEEVVVVSDGRDLLQPASRSGDEPQMLARALPAVPVVVARKRVRAGRVAESDLGATVHLLDDGFQHLRLARDVELVIVSAADLHDEVLPGGRLRESIEAARCADALLVPGSDDEARAVAGRFGSATMFRLSMRYGALRAMNADEAAGAAAAGGRAVAVAGIARPERFFTALKAQGVDVVREIAFRDHHWFSAADMAGIASAARETGASLVVTTEKDAVRMVECGATRAGLAGGPRDSTLHFVVLPMTAVIEPHGAFAAWLSERLRLARRRRGEAA